MSDPIKIFYCIDRNVQPQFELSAASVMRYNPEAEITVVSASPLETRYHNLVVKLPEVKFRHAAADRLTDAAYMRVFLPDWLPGLDKALYLDADTLCTGPLDELWSIQPDYLGAVHSHDYGVKQAQQIGIDLYMLDSVLLLNLKNLRKCGFTQNFLAAMQYDQYPHTNWYCGETVLNVGLRELITPLPLRWNYCIDRHYTQYPDAIPESEAVILHFIGPDKRKQRVYYDRMTSIIR